MKLKGKVYDNRITGANGIYNANVFISDEFGTPTPSRISGSTDPDGNFELDVPVQKMGGINVPLFDGKFITAKIKASDTANKVITMPLEAGKPLNFDVSSLGLNRTIEEVKITAKRKQPEVMNNCDNCKKLKNYKIALGVTASALVILAGIMIHCKMKHAS